MKCEACGYKVLESWLTNDGERIGDEDFIIIKNGNNHFSSPRGFDEDREIHLYGCPKCNTVQFE